MHAAHKDLLHQLLAHACADATEREYLEDMRALLGTSEDPFARDHFVPGHFTASAFILNRAADSMLLIHHRKLNRWLQPGGHIDPQDAGVEAAARREVEEEAGLSKLTGGGQIFDVDVHTIPSRKHEPEHRHFDVRLLFTAESEEARAGSDARDTRWVHLDEVQDLDTDQSVLRAVQKLRATR